MTLTRAQIEQIVDLIIPFCTTEDARIILVNRLFAGVNPKINIDFGGDANKFVWLFLGKLEVYGKIDNEPALWVLLDQVICKQVGPDKQAIIDSLRAAILPAMPLPLQMT
jgi:hypothetical protein